MSADQPEWVLQSRRELGRRVQTARMHADLTQEELEERTGIGRRTIQRIESGANDAKISHLLLIARAVGVSIHDLLP
ncbi:helix-turn-helix domain-containing protein [Streptomyces sp. NPDC015131]|uniref:helix-turn-helix domain-containing protein n=1 Tax=Streptomyces sp. NPDC015131 TaxID=3364941 RepID=UPI0037014D88